MMKKHSIIIITLFAVSYYTSKEKISNHFHNFPNRLLWLCIFSVISIYIYLFIFCLFSHIFNALLPTAGINLIPKSHSSDAMMLADEDCHSNWLRANEK